MIAKITLIYPAIITMGEIKSEINPDTSFSMYMAVKPPITNKRPNAISL
jgi:hypothetical protein